MYLETSYAEIATGTVTTLHALRIANPDTMYPDPLTPTEGYAPLDETLPAHDPMTQRISFSETATKQDGKWSRTITVIDLTPEERRALLPESCTPAQGLVALFALKSITETDIHTAIAGIPDPVDRYTAQIAFSKATEWRRGSPSVQTLAALLGLSEGDLDDLFSYAAGVSV